MKKRNLRLLLMAVLMCLVIGTALSSNAADIVPIGKKTFPDPAFRQYVMGMAGAEDGYFQQAELEAVTKIDCSGLGIKDLTGLENFMNLAELDCSRNDIEELTIKYDRNNPVLQKLISVNISECPKIKTIEISGNEVEKLSVRRCSSLTELGASSNNLTDFTVSGCDKLEEINVANNKLKSLNGIGFCKGLEKLRVYNNDLSEIKLDGFDNLYFLDYSYNEKVGESVFISNCPELNRISCSGTGLTSFPFTKEKYPNLGCVVISENNIKEISLDQIPDIHYLIANRCGLEKLDTSAAKKLWILECARNNLKSLDLSLNKELGNLVASDNKLTYLNLEKSKDLLGNLAVGVYSEGGVSSLVFQSYSCNGNSRIVKDGDPVSQVMPGIDMSRVINVRGGSLSAGIVNFDPGSQEILYEYKLFNNKKDLAEFRLVQHKLEGGMTYSVEGRAVDEVWSGEHIEPVFTGAAADIPKELIRSNWQYSNDGNSWKNSGYGIYGHDVERGSGYYLRNVATAIGYAGEIVGPKISVTETLNKICVEVHQPVEDVLPSYYRHFHLEEADYDHIYTTYNDDRFNTFYWINEQGVDQKDDQPFKRGEKYECNMNIAIDHYYRTIHKLDRNVEVYINGHEARVHWLDDFTCNVSYTFVAEPSPIKKIDFAAAEITRPMDGMEPGDITASVSEDAPYYIYYMSDWFVGNDWRNSVAMAAGEKFEGGKTYFAELCFFIKDTNAYKFAKYIGYAGISGADKVVSCKTSDEGDFLSIILRVDVSDPNIVSTAPVFSHNSMDYNGDAFYVTVTASDPRVRDIYYTLDGSDPTDSSSYRYKIHSGETVRIEWCTRTLKAASYYDGMYSPVTEATYTYMMDVYFNTDVGDLKITVDGVDRSGAAMPMKIAEGSKVRLEAFIPDGYRFNDWVVSELDGKPEDKINPAEFYIGNSHDGNSKQPLEPNIVPVIGNYEAHVRAPQVYSNIPPHMWNMDVSTPRDAKYVCEVSKIFEILTDGTERQMRPGDVFEPDSNYIFEVSFESANANMYMSDNVNIKINGVNVEPLGPVNRGEYGSSFKARVTVRSDYWITYADVNKNGEYTVSVNPDFAGEFLVAAEYDRDGKMIDSEISILSQNDSYSLGITVTGRLSAPPQDGDIRIFILDRYTFKPLSTYYTQRY